MLHAVSSRSMREIVIDSRKNLTIKVNSLQRPESYTFRTTEPKLTGKYRVISLRSPRLLTKSRLVVLLYLVVMNESSPRPQNHIAYTTMLVLCVCTREDMKTSDLHRSLPIKVTCARASNLLPPMPAGMSLHCYTYLFLRSRLGYIPFSQRPLLLDINCPCLGWGHA